LEYGIPLADLNKGWGSFPFFLRDLNMVLFADTMAVDGGAYSNDFRGYVCS
jgi:hypothetical protein